MSDDVDRPQQAADQPRSGDAGQHEARHSQARDSGTGHSETWQPETGQPESGQPESGQPGNRTGAERPQGLISSTPWGQGGLQDVRAWSGAQQESAGGPGSGQRPGTPPVPGGANPAPAGAASPAPTGPAASGATSSAASAPPRSAGEAVGGAEQDGRRPEDGPQARYAAPPNPFHQARRGLDHPPAPAPARPGPAPSAASADRASASSAASAPRAVPPAQQPPTGPAAPTGQGWWDQAGAGTSSSPAPRRSASPSPAQHGWQQQPGARDGQQPQAPQPGGHQPGSSQGWPGPQQPGTAASNAGWPQPYPSAGTPQPGMPQHGMPPGAQPGPAGSPADGPAPAPAPPQPRHYSAGELIDQLNPQPAVTAKRGLRARLGLKPSARELAEQRDEDAARTPFTRPVTIMIANPKGGVGKTPTTLLLAAAFGTSRGGGVIAWDNNELRGTMPDRSFSPHRRTVRDLLDETDRIASPQSQFTDLAQFLNHQTTGKFHTLGSAQTSGHVISKENFEAIHDILARYFQIILVDTGNNEASPNWLAAASAADCLVVPTKWRKDSLIPAARMLETLQEFNRDLLNRTVVVATNGPADSQEEVKRSGAQWFTGHQIVEIPTDPHVAEGGVIDWSKLEQRTRRAALHLAATVAERIATVAT